MIVLDIATRRKGLAAIAFDTPAPKMEGAEYEGDRLLVDREIIARCGIKKGEELNLNDIKELCYVSECFRAKQRAIWHLSASDCSEKALYEKLCRSFSKKASAFAVAQMVERGYVNDYKYAVYLAKKFRKECRSRREASEKLYLKGISPDLANRVLLELAFEKDEAGRAAGLIKSKYLNKISDEESVKKTIAALQRKGYGFADIKKALEIVLNSLGDREEAEEIF